MQLRTTGPDRESRVWVSTRVDEWTSDVKLLCRHIFMIAGACVMHGAD